MSAERRLVKVRILDREYAFASKGEAEDEHLREVARQVDERMRQVRTTAPNLTPMQTAVLAGLELVDELLRMRRDVSAVEADISQRTNRLTESLEQLLRGVDSTPLPDRQASGDSEA